jgi:transposase-like protein
MKNTNFYPGYPYPSSIISHAVWLYYIFTLGFRNIEELLAATGNAFSYKTIRNIKIKKRRDDSSESYSNGNKSQQSGCPPQDSHL